MSQYRDAAVKAGISFKFNRRLTAQIYGEEAIKKSTDGTADKDDEEELKWSQFYHDVYDNAHQFFFPDIPEHYPLKKKLLMAKGRTYFGSNWDLLLILFSVLCCCTYVAGLYDMSYATTYILSTIEFIVTQFFLVDFLFNWFVANDQVSYFTNPMTWVDLLTIMPVYISLALKSSKIKLSIFRFLRILRLVRVLRAFRLLKGLTGVTKKLITLILTVLSLIFLAAGINQLMENDILQQLEFGCLYIGPETNFEPSCLPYAPSFNDTISCDCQEHNCRSGYSTYDPLGEPSNIKCNVRSFFTCLYYIIVTMASVGYGDFSPSNNYSRVVIIVFIFSTMILIPVQINDLNSMLSQKSAFRDPFEPTADSTHIIIVGDVNNRGKIEPFFKEFFHPDRTSSDIRAVILSIEEPNEDLKSFISIPVLESRIVFMIGSPLVVADLIRARADLARAIFYICNAECSEETSNVSDASTITSLLSVINFNPKLECFAQVINSGCRDVLKESSVDVVVCLDDLRTILMARNAVCHGYSTLIELLFMCFGTVQAKSEPWYADYLHGASGEVYLIPINFEYFDALNFQWTIAVEGIFLEFGVVLIGVCNVQDQKVCLNPDFRDFEAFESSQAFFDYFNVGIVIADEQLMASIVATSTGDESKVRSILSKVLECEKLEFSCRVGMMKAGQKSRRGNIPVSRRETKPENFSLNNLNTLNTNLSDREQLSMMVTDVNVINNLRKLTSAELLEVSQLYQSSVAAAFSASKISAEDSDSSDESVVSDLEEEKFIGVAVNSTVDTADAHRKSAFSDTLSPKEKNRGRLSANGALPRGDSFVKEKDLLNLLDENRKHSKVKREREDVGNVTNHIVVYGCMNNIFEFISELRRPCVVDIDPHAIVIVDEDVPPKWDYITKKFREVYFIRGSLMKSNVFNRANVKHAYAVVSLANRKEIDLSEDDNRDSETLFSFLKLEAHIPSNVFFTVELISPQNLSVLNSTVVTQSKKNLELHGLLKNVQNFSVKSVMKSRSEIAKEYQNVVKSDITQQTHGTFIQKKIKIGDLASNRVKNKSQNVNIEENSDQKVKGEQNGPSVTGNGFWDATNTHHMLPVFASGIAFTPAIFDTLLCQSFYNTLIPAICDAMVCGQGHKTAYLVKVPSNFIGRSYSTVFRAFNSRNILCLGIYRAVNDDDKSILPFVYTCPKGDTIMRENDSVYIFGNSFLLRKSTISFDLPLIPANESKSLWILGHING